MTDENILIIGAGAAGLMAARTLIRQGKQVTIIEAREKTGGRILDINDDKVDYPFMLGAEFIHGEASLTMELLAEAGLSYYEVGAGSYRFEGGRLQPENEFDGHWPDFMNKLELLTEDISLTDFLAASFAGEEYQELREHVRNFAEGFDAADPDRVSMLALKKEWQQEAKQYRVKGGYGKLMRFLEDECIRGGASILTEKVVSHFSWSKDVVEAITKDGERILGHKVIITVPLGVLKVKDGSLGSVNFTPPLPVKMEAIRAMGFGAVIKVVLCFKENFWSQDVPEAGFIFSEETIPTWWTQAPDPAPVLTGWLAGPKAEQLCDQSDEDLLEAALRSLSNIFSRKQDELKAALVRGHAYNWKADPFSRGAYSYTTVSSDQALQVLLEPVQETLFFAGEAVYEGPHTATVEAALQSGKAAAEKILKSSR